MLSFEKWLETESKEIISDSLDERIEEIYAEYIYQMNQQFHWNDFLNYETE
jgi:hypothetical protein